MRENTALTFKKIEGPRHFILYFYTNSFSFKYAIMFPVLIKLELRMFIKKCKLEIIASTLCVHAFRNTFKMVYKMTQRLKHDYSCPC